VHLKKSSYSFGENPLIQNIPLGDSGIMVRGNTLLGSGSLIPMAKDAFETFYMSLINK